MNKIFRLATLMSGILLFRNLCPFRCLIRRQTFALMLGIILFPALSQTLVNAQVEINAIDSNPEPAPQVFQAAGTSVAAVGSNVDAFRAALGTLNPNVPGSFGGGRREVNWDGVPDSFSAPNFMPANFFNVNSPRGVVFSTPGEGFQTSADDSNPTNTPIKFGNLNANYPSIFNVFSPQRLFTSIGSNITEVSFFIPGSTTPATTKGFGAVFTDVDFRVETNQLRRRASTKIEYFDKSGRLLFSSTVPSSNGNGNLSFLGVVFAEARLARVRITSGNECLGLNVDDGRRTDVVAMDDFIYGEPLN